MGVSQMPTIFTRYENICRGKKKTKKKHMVLHGSYQQDTSTCTKKRTILHSENYTTCYKFYPSKPKISFNITN